MIHTARHRRLPLVAVGIAVLLWSMSFGISSEVLKTASPAVLSVGRFAIGLIVLVPLAARRPLFVRTLRDPRTILLGFLGVAVYYSLTNIGLDFTTPGTAALSNAALPALTALLGLFILKERLAPRTIIGLVLATAGVVIVAGAGLTVDIGVLLCLIGLASYALYTVLLRKGVPTEPRQASAARQMAGAVDPLVLATATAVWGTAIMLPWLVPEMATGAASLPSGWGGLGGLLILGVVITAPTLVLFNYGAERLPAAATGVLTAAIPALGYLFALVLGEPFDAITALGGAVALVGVAIASVTAPSTDSSPAGSALPPHEVQNGPGGLVSKDGKSHMSESSSSYEPTPQEPLNSGFGPRTTALEAIDGIDLTGRNAIVTGGYSGLGIEVVRALVSAGASVTVPARRPEVAREALDAAGLGAVTVDEMDLADQDSVASFAARYLESGRGLDLLINNAAVMAAPLTRVGPGWESQFATNHLGHFTLTNLLWPLLAAAPDGARVVELSSTGHKLSPIRFDDLNFEQGYDKWAAYGQAKTANSLFAVELDARGSRDGVRAFAVHPGGIMTPLQRHLPREEMIAAGWMDAEGNVDDRFKTPEQGAATTVWAATSPQLAGKGGVYLEDVDIALPTDPESPSARVRGVDAHAIDRDAAARLWQVSAELTNVDAFN